MMIPNEDEYYERERERIERSHGLWRIPDGNEYCGDYDDDYGFEEEDDEEDDE